MNELREYNGWTNYATWDAYNWLTSYENTYDTAREIVEAEPDDDRAGDTLKEWVEEGSPLADDASLYSDLLTWALGFVDWRALAAALRE